MSTKVTESRLVVSAQDKTAAGLASAERRVKRANKLIGDYNKKAAAVDRAERTRAKAARFETAKSAGGMAVGVGSGRLLTGLGAAVAGSAVAGAVVDYADLERQMTRVGLAAGASADETKAATKDVSELAQRLALPLDQAVTGLESLVATGKSMPEAMSFLPEILKAAQASGAATDDMSASANSLATSFKVSASEMGRAFDMLVAGGEAGQFELRDMARYLPSLTASAQKLGFTGLDGTRKLVAMLQTVRLVSGTSEEAATAARDAFEKLLSPTVAKQFAEHGINIGRVLESAAKKGQNGFEAVLDELDKLTKGMSDTKRDLLLSSIFTEADSRRAITALIKLRSEYRAYEKQVENSAGAVDRNLNRVLADTKASVDRLTNSWGQLWKSIGRGADAAGASTAMDKLSKAIDHAVDYATNPQARKDRALITSQAEHKRNIADKTQQVFDAEQAIGAKPPNYITPAAGDEDGLEPWQVALRRNQNLIATSPDNDRLQQNLQRALEQRALAVAAAGWDAIDRDGWVAPAWMRQKPDAPSNVGGLPYPLPDPLRGADGLSYLQRQLERSPSLPGGDLPPTAWPVTPLTSPAAPTEQGIIGAPLGEQFDVDALRNAMQAGSTAGADISQGGIDAAAAISAAARQLEVAAQSIAENGRAAAAAISAAKPQMPAMGLGRAGHQRPPINMVQGYSMPNAGIAGGGGN